MKSARHRKIIISYLANHISLPSRNTIGYTARLFSNYSIIRAARLKANPDYCRYYVIKHTAKINIVSNLEYLALRANARFQYALRFSYKIQADIYTKFSHVSGKFERRFAPRICLVNEKDSNGILFTATLENLREERSIFVLNSLRT